MIVRCIKRKGDSEMAECELLSGCIFFNDNMTKMPATAELMKNNLCRGNKLQCARYMVYQQLGRPKVPADLYPNDVERAKLIISSK